MLEDCQIEANSTSQYLNSKQIQMSKSKTNSKFKAQNNRIQLNIGFLHFCHSGLDPVSSATRPRRESSDFAFLLIKRKNYEISMRDTQVAGYRLEFTPYSIRGRYDMNLTGF